MATSAPRTLTDLPLEFRAPPPSPAAIGGSHRNCETENDEFGGFLNRSVRVPQLVLPDRILNQRETAALWAPPEIDLRKIDGEMLRSAARSGGCFKIVGHGIRREVIERVGVLAGRAFRLPPEAKRAVSRTGDRRWGFEVEEEEESEGEEFLWWDEKGGEKLAGIWPKGHKKFRRAMQSFWGEMENIASKIGLILLQDIAHMTDQSSSSRITTIMDGSILCLHRPSRKAQSEQNSECSPKQSTEARYSENAN